MSLVVKAPKMWMITQPVDFRYAIDGLSALIINGLGYKPTEGVFVFINRKRNRLKLLLWHNNGFVLIYKRLERGLFTLPASDDQTIIINEKQLSWLLAGLDWHTMSHFNELKYDDYS